MDTMTMAVTQVSPASVTQLLSYDDAASIVRTKAKALRNLAPGTELAPLQKAAGRTLAAPLAADCDQPPFDRAIRDGYACRASEINLHEALPVCGTSRAGDAPSERLPEGCVREIMTGAPMPAGADAVLMFEDAERTRDRVRITSGHQLSSRENIVARGAQSRSSDVLLAPGTLLGYAQIALAASVGASELRVYKRPVVAILTTGDELVPIETTPPPGKIRDSSTSMLAALVEARGGIPWILPTAPDDLEAMDHALAEAAAADMLLITGGVSAGKFDFVEPALLRRGAQLHFTGARIQPGKPVVFGEMPRSHGPQNSSRNILPVFGLPGNPVSSAVTFLLFAAPVLAAVAGCISHGPRFALAEMDTAAYEGKPGLTRFLPAFCDFSATPSGAPVVSRVSWQGSGDLAALARANCYAVIPEGTSSIEAGSIVHILLV